MKKNAQYRPQGDEISGVGHDHDGRDRWLRVAVTVLGVFLGGLFVLLFSDTFEHGMAVAIFFTFSSWVPAMYSLALLLKPWAKDELGRDRSTASATAAERRWYQSGILGNFVIMLIVVSLIPAGVVHLSSGRVLEPLTIACQLLLIGLLTLLDQHARHRQQLYADRRT